jgi:alpha-beta hydrolase superfamily lysophospholipase
MRRRLGIIAAVILGLCVLWFGVAPAGIGLKHTALAGSPQDYGVTFETVEFRPKDVALSLRAWWMPVENPKAVLVMVHDGGDNRSHPYMHWLGLARALFDHRYAVMDIDLRNHGESGDTPSGRSTLGVDEAADVRAAIDYVAQRRPEARFAGLGYSMGGQTLLYAAASDRRLEAVVSDGTYADARAIVATFAHAATEVPTLLFSAPFVWSAEYLHRMPLGARAVDVIARIAPRPVLLIHDADDPIVSVEHCHRLARAYPAARAWITSTPPAQRPPPPWGTHAMSYRLHTDEYVRRVSGFFDQVFASPLAPTGTP